MSSSTVFDGIVTSVNEEKALGGVHIGTKHVLFYFNNWRKLDYRHGGNRTVLRFIKPNTEFVAPKIGDRIVCVWPGQCGTVTQWAPFADYTEVMQTLGFAEDDIPSTERFSRYDLAFVEVVG